MMSLKILLAAVFVCQRNDAERLQKVPKQMEQ